MKFIGKANWRYHSDDEGAWYVRLDEASAPIKRQAFVQAILDLDAEGRLIGIEIIDTTDGKPILPPSGVGPAEG